MTRIESAIDRRCAQRAEDIFQKLVESAQFDVPVHLVCDDATALDGRPDGGRACAATEIATDGDAFVYVTWRFLTRFSKDQQEGVLRHELGHVSLLLQGKEHNEREADAEVKRLFGKPIRYDSRDIQTIGSGGPRPRHIENPDSGCCIVRNPEPAENPLAENPLADNPGAWDLKRIHALFGYTDGAKIPKDVQDERVYRGVRVRLLKSKPDETECRACNGYGRIESGRLDGRAMCTYCNGEGVIKVKPSRGGKGHRIVVDCPCGKTVGFGRMVAHALGGSVNVSKGLDALGGCDFARQTFFSPKKICNCSTCVKEQRELDEKECPNKCKWCRRHIGEEKNEAGDSVFVDDARRIDCQKHWEKQPGTGREYDTWKPHESQNPELLTPRQPQTNPTPLAKRHPFPLAEELYASYLQSRAEHFPANEIANKLTLEDIRFFIEAANLMYEAAPDNLPASFINLDVFACADGLLSSTMNPCDSVGLHPEHNRGNRLHDRKSGVTFYFNDASDECNTVWAFAQTGYGTSAPAMRDELQSAGWLPEKRHPKRSVKRDLKPTRYGLPPRIVQALALDSTNFFASVSPHFYAREVPKGWKKCMFCNRWLVQGSPPYSHEWIDGAQDERCRASPFSPKLHVPMTAGVTMVDKNIIRHYTQLHAALGAALGDEEDDA